MPRLSQWMLKFAFGYLLLGFALGVLLLMGKVTWLSPSIWQWRSIHIECLQVGWIFHLGLGVAYWIFPRVERTLRPRSELAWISVAQLNLGIGLYCLGVFGNRTGLIQLGRLFEFLALILFATHLWPRIKAFEA